MHQWGLGTHRPRQGCVTGGKEVKVRVGVAQMGARMRGYIEGGWKVRVVGGMVEGKQVLWGCEWGSIRVASCRLGVLG